MGASLGPKYIPCTYMDPLGLVRYSIPTSWRVVTRGVIGYRLSIYSSCLLRRFGFRGAPSPRLRITYVRPFLGATLNP